MLLKFSYANGIEIYICIQYLYELKVKHSHNVSTNSEITQLATPKENDESLGENDVSFLSEKPSL